MKKFLLRELRCPECRKSKKLKLTDSELETDDEIHEAELVCKKGHEWTVEEGIPLLVYPPLSAEDKKWIEDYDQMAETYDEAIKTYDEFLGVDIMKEREKLVGFIPMEGPATIIDVSIGTAANFMAISNALKGQIGRFNFHGLDVSRGMLRVAQRKLTDQGIAHSLVHGSVFNIPYADNTFDLVIHSGGINTFSDIPKALNEMLRIAKPWGVIVVSDEGLSSKARETEWGKKIIENNSLFAAKPPLEHLPDNAKHVEVSWILNDAFYQIVFQK